VRSGPTHPIFAGRESYAVMAGARGIGTGRAGRVGLDRVVSPSPAFSAHLIKDHSQSVLVRFLRERSGDELLARYMGASSLSHPNLVRCFGAGLYGSGISRYVYVIVETTEAALARILQERSLSLEEVRDLGIQLASGLSYLHKRNLICCGLDTSTVARSGRSWKIEDYSQLRVAGDGSATKTRGLLTNSPSVPPEAYVGIVSPAWDSWSLGIVLTAALIGPKGERRAGRAARREFPKSVEPVIAECLSTDLRARCGVERVATLLTERPLHSAKRAPQLAPTNPPPLETRFRQDARERKWRWPIIAAGAGAVAACALLAAIILNSARPAAQPRPVPAATTVQKPGPEVPDPVRNAAPPTGDPALASEPQGPDDSAQIYS
jgi:serine/threonine protein kinase